MSCGDNDAAPKKYFDPKSRPECRSENTLVAAGCAAKWNQQPSPDSEDRCPGRKLFQYRMLTASSRVKREEKSCVRCR